jgi:hypothetical protein
MKLSTLFLFLIIPISFFAQGKPFLRESDRIRINEAFKIEEKFGDKVWKDWNKVPFAVDLVTDSAEFLIKHPNPSPDFKLVGYDSLLQSNIYYRKRIFDKHLLATFPAVNALSTIVVGIPENTRKSSVAWIITLLHEHFHQLQSAQKDYYASVNGLDLAGSDSTGMWMLNYPFPYEDKKINDAYDSLKIALTAAIKSEEGNDKKLLIKNYLEKKEVFKNLLNEKDYRYFSFQLWQEGIARYTELTITKTLLDCGYVFSDAVKNLNDFIELKNFYNDYYNNEINLLHGLSLYSSKRICFYAVGTGEGFLLDFTNPEWKKLYFNDKFYLEKYY